MVLLANFLFNLLCSVVSCNPKYPYPTDPDHTFGRSLDFERTGRAVRHGNDSLGFRINNEISDDGENLDLEKYPIVETNIGAVQGFTMQTISGRSVYAFQGIPYGETTGGENRFEPPVPKRKWHGIRKAFSPGGHCLQTYWGRVPLLQGREDCLFLSIYTLPKSINSTRKLPVLFWIHGGGFNFGGESDYGPAYMLEHDVILVTINYRLNLFGFLSTEDDVVPGNNGLKDQALALKWVYENIGNFGGDPNEITIMGQSAGAASVHFHMVGSYYDTSSVKTHMERPRYFARAISLSGNTFSCWALRSPEKNSYLNKRLAKKTGCPIPDGKNSREFVQCLKSISPLILNSIQLSLFPLIVVPIILFSPVLEKPRSSTPADETDLGRPFITRHPDDLYAEGAVDKIPWLVSRTSGEAYLASYITKGFGVISRYVFNLLWKKQSADFLDYRGLVSTEDEMKITKKIENYYYGGKTISELDGTVFDDIITYRDHITAVHKGIQAHSTVAPTHAMLISGPINFETTLASVIGVNQQPRAVLHADEVFLIFNSTGVVRGLRSTEEGFNFSRHMTEIVFNFANNGSTSYSGELVSPDFNDHWDAVDDPCKVRYLNVTLHNGNKMTELPRKVLENFDFWLTLGLKDIQKSPNLPLPTCPT